MHQTTECRGTVAVIDGCPQICLVVFGHIHPECEQSGRGARSFIETGTLFLGAIEVCPLCLCSSQIHPSDIRIPQIGFL